MTSFTRTTIAITISVNGAGMCWGVMISPTAATAIPMAAPSSMSETIAAARDSTLP